MHFNQLDLLIFMFQKYLLIDLVCFSDRNSGRTRKSVYKYIKISQTYMCQYRKALGNTCFRRLKSSSPVFCRVYAPTYRVVLSLRPGKGNGSPTQPGIPSVWAVGVST